MPSERIERDLRQRLASDEWQSGDMLPTLVQLAGHYQASRGTVARVLRTLADDGLVVVRARWGVFKVLATVARLARIGLDGAERAGGPRSRPGRCDGHVPISGRFLGDPRALGGDSSPGPVSAGAQWPCELVTGGQR